MAVPMGIAVDTANSKLYWTNSRGRIQSANLNGSRITNVVEDLQGPKDITVARGIVFWTQFNASTGQGRLGITNPNAGQNGTRYISTGSDSPMSLVVAGNKVYWTERTGVSSGTINSANLNGSGVMELASILAVPMGIGVDTARSKLYWTNSRGRIQSADLTGNRIQNVVGGLGDPGDMVLSNSLVAPAGTPPAVAAKPPASQYDVNGDGKVNNTDASLVAAAMNTSNAKYDVNGDGTVNFLDLLLVFDNRDAGAAGAPTIVGMQLSAVEIDVIEEQIDLLIATGDRSPAAMRTLIYLQQLIATARPEKTQLLANYPNPFNPETWIPYELATDTTVKITIYNTQGVVIRTLELGHQSAGYYTGRDRAAYWDGRNAFGEQVASGVYFYQFETDEMSSM
ncbi:MAG: dockerin type I domain-containing protein, partial [Proteobacteria bacterium]|nr:dockerin type I domain-containing protein [Pseudomonadota bacterium]